MALRGGDSGHGRSWHCTGPCPGPERPVCPAVTGREVLRQLCCCLGCARWKFLAKAGHAHPPLRLSAGARAGSAPAPARPCQVTDRRTDMPTDMPGPAAALGLAGTEACLPGQRPHWHSRTLTRPALTREAPSCSCPPYPSQCHPPSQSPLDSVSVSQGSPGGQHPGIVPTQSASHEPSLQGSDPGALLSGGFWGSWESACLTCLRFQFNPQLHMNAPPQPSQGCHQVSCGSGVQGQFCEKLV